MVERSSLKKLYAIVNSGEKIACLTAYDASFARLLERCGIDIILVGDSLGMVLHGAQTTLQVSISDMIYHTRQVSSGSRQSFIIADMPFMSYATPSQALGNATRLFTEGGCQMVKLEGGQELVGTVQLLTQHGMPVCAHLGLQPQFVNQLGGYGLQATDDESAEKLLDDAKKLQAAGAKMLVLECVCRGVANKITACLSIPTIGIGSGSDCCGQVLVLYDILGVVERTPHFVKNFLESTGSIEGAVHSYVKSVKSGSFPST